MTEAKFKQNVARSTTASHISEFSGDDITVQKEVKDDFDEQFPIVNSSSDLDQTETKEPDTLLQGVNGASKQQQQQQQPPISQSSKPSLQSKQQSLQQQQQDQLLKPQEVSAQRRSNSTSSQTISMSRSRAKDVLTPENFSTHSVIRLEGINTLITLKGDTSIKQQKRKRLNSRLKKWIAALRIFRKDFSLSVQMTQQNVFEIQRGDLCTFRSNQFLIAHPHSVRRFAIDVDYFRVQEILNNDKSSYTAIVELDGHKIGLANSLGELIISDLEKARFSQLMSLSQQIKTDPAVALTPSFSPAIFMTRGKSSSQIQQQSASGALYSAHTDGIVQSWDVAAGKLIWRRDDIEQKTLEAKCLEIKDFQLLITCEKGFQLLDIRKPESVVVKRETSEYLNKAILGLIDHEILYFESDSNILHCYNDIIEKETYQREFTCQLRDLLYSHTTKELVALIYHEDEKVYTSSIEVMERRFGRLCFKDRLVQKSTVRGIQHIKLDDAGQILYAVNGEHLRAWRFYQKDENDTIRSNLEQLVN